MPVQLHSIDCTKQTNWQFSSVQFILPKVQSEFSSIHFVRSVHALLNKSW